MQKPSVARVIVRAIRNGDPPGRFLRKDDATNKWVDVGDKKAAEKTSQALREKPSDKKPGELTNAPTGILLPNPASYLAAATASAMLGDSIPPKTNVVSTIKAEVAPEAKNEEAKANKDEPQPEEPVPEAAVPPETEAVDVNVETEESAIV